MKKLESDSIENMIVDSHSRTSPRDSLEDGSCAHSHGAYPVFTNPLVQKQRKPNYEQRSYHQEVEENRSPSPDIENHILPKQVM